MAESTAPFSAFVGRRFAARSPVVSWLVFERLGGALAFLLAKAAASPTAITLVGGALGILGALRLATADEPAQAVVAAVLLLSSYTLDCTDGQLARATGRASSRGAWLDVVTDGVVIAFVGAGLTIALLDGGGSPVGSVLLAGAYGASRTANLVTSSQVRADDGGLRLTGLSSIARTAYVGLIDTPVVYFVLCSALLFPNALRWVLALLTVMTLVQTLVSARHHFAPQESSAAV
jgi:phosphatidylglycerophosphate synthase